MARTGVTYFDISKAASSIQAKGENPTVDRVREWLGTGSKGTIAPLLKQWKHENAPESSQNVHHNLPPDLLSLTQGLWDGLKGRSEQIMSDEREKFSKQLNHASETNADLTEKLQNNHRELESLEEKHQSLSDEFELLQTQYQEQVRKIDYLSGQTHQQQQRIEDNVQTISKLSEQAKMAYENLEHFRQSAQQQREQEHLEFDRQRSQWQQQELAAKTAITDLETRLDKETKAHQHAAIERKSYLEDKNRLEKQLASTLAEKDQVTQLYQEAINQNISLSKHNDQLQESIESVKRERSDLHGQLISLQRQIVQYNALEQKLESIQSKLDAQCIT